MISDRSSNNSSSTSHHHHVSSISGPGDGMTALKNGITSHHMNGGSGSGLVVSSMSASAAAQHQANLVAGMNLISQGFHHQQQQQQQGNHLNNINALQQQHNSLNSLLQQQQHQGHAILGSGVSSSSSSAAALVSGSASNQNNQNYDYAVRLAAEANSKATIEKDYYKAIILYGDAISLHSGDCRFFLNRSYCYAQLELYQLALDDAEDAIRLDPKSGKCYYRKGQALIGLKKFMDAEKAFHEVLRLEPDCPETSKQLIEVRFLSLQSLGFDLEQCRMAALKYKSIEEAISALLALRMDESSFSDQTLPPPQQSAPSQKWPPSVSSMWDHPSDLSQKEQLPTGSGWGPLTVQQQANGSEGNLMGSGLRNTNSGGVIGSGQSQHQVHLINGYGSEFSTKTLNGSGTGVDVASSPSNSNIATPVSNGFSSIVGSNGPSFYQRMNERPNSSSPLDKLTDSLSLNQQHVSHHQHHQMVMGNNMMNANNCQQNRMMTGALINHPNDQISVFDGSCISKSSVVGASYSSAVHASNLIPNHVLATSGHVADYPKNNTANNFNGISNSFANTSSRLTNNQQQQHHHQASGTAVGSAVIGSGRHASGGGSSSGHVSSAITTGSFGLASAVVCGSNGASAAVSGLSIGSGGVCGGDSEPSISPAVSNSDSDSSITIMGAAEPGVHANQHYNRRQVMQVGAVNYKQQQQQQQSQIGNRLINGSSSGVMAPAAVTNAATAAGLVNKAVPASGSVWGSSSGGGGSAAGGTFADIVKKKSAPAVAASGSKNNVNNNNNNNNSNKRSESAVNGKNHHNQAKDQVIGSMAENASDTDPSDHQIKESVVSRGSNGSSNPILISKRPTNIWGYNGLRVANVSPTCSRSTLTSMFSKFGKLKPVERITNKNVDNQVWVFYDNAVSPIDVIAKYQGVVVPGISLNNSTPLKFYFAATDDQKDLKFSRPKQPQDSRGECYYWRTTNCFSRESCSLLHLPSCKNIDAQVWMKMNREPNNTSNTNGTN